MNRDLFAAISEYAPESEVVADGQLLRSRYVRKLSGYEWPKYKYAICPECFTMNKTSYVSEIKKCRQCGIPLNGRGHQYIIPKFGFLLDTERAKPVGLNKPERTYKGSISYIGDENKIEFHEYQICGHQILLGNSKMDSLAVLNESPFFICESCGYGHIDNKTGDEFISLPNHKNSNGYKCGNEHLRRYALGHELQILANMLREGFRVVSNCDCGGEAADTACYSCLCNYYNQRQHDILKRRYAIDFYQQFSASYENEWEYYRDEEKAV